MGRERRINTGKDASWCFVELSEGIGWHQLCRTESEVLRSSPAPHTKAEHLESGVGTLQGREIMENSTK